MLPLHTIRRFASEKPLRFSLLVVLVLQLFAVVALRTSYETIDDVFLTMIASGKGICPAPDQHLVFTNVLIGDVLKWLYTCLPSLPWYGLYLLVVHYAAQAAILFCALTIGQEPFVAKVRKRASGFGSRMPADLDDSNRNASRNAQLGARLGLYLLCFGLIETQFLNRMQFTTTAFVSAQAGIFLALLAWRRRVQHADVPVFRHLSAAVVFLVLGGMIRLDSLAMALMAASPVILLFVWDFSRRAIIPCGIAAVAATALLGGAVAYDHSVYERDPLWHGYRSLNQLRGKFQDSSWTYYSPQTADIFSRVGWSENDHEMIAHWFSDDPDLYNAAKLTNIVGAYPWQASRRMSGLFWSAFRDIMRNRTVLSLLLALPFVLSIVPGGWRSKLLILASAVAVLPLIAVVIWLKKVPPERVYLPLISFPLSTALLSFAWPVRQLPQGALRRTWTEQIKLWWIWAAWRRLPTRLEVTATLLVVAVIMGGYRQCRQCARVQHDRVAMERFLNDIRSDGRSLYVMWEAALPLDLTSPLDNLDSWTGIPMVSVAWPQRTPWQQEIKRRFGISSLTQSLCENDNIVLIATEAHRSLFKTFAKEHFGADIDFLTFQRAGDQLVAGTFHRKLPGDNTALKQRDGAQR